MRGSAFFTLWLYAGLTAVLLSGAARAGAGEAAPSRFSHLTIDKGLSQGAINSILQDRKGFLWFGTKDGLNRFDGYSFTVYRHNIADKDSLPSSQIICLFEDSRDALWVGTDQGLCRFDSKTGKFVRVFLPGMSGDRHVTVQAFLEDTAGMLWIGTRRDGLVQLDPRTLRVLRWFSVPVVHPMENRVDGVCSLCMDKTGGIWVGTENQGLFFLEPFSGRFSPKLLPSAFQKDEMANTAITVLLADPGGDVWIGTYGCGLLRLDPKTEAVRRFRWQKTDPTSLGDDYITALAPGGGGRLWVATNSAGLQRLDTTTGKFFHYRHDPRNPGSLSSDLMLSVVVDRSGIVWAGTNGMGIDCLLPHPSMFQTWRPLPGREGCLHFPSIRSFAEAGERVLVGGYGGLEEMELPAGLFRHIPWGERDASLDIARVNGVDNLCIYSIVRENSSGKDTYWLGTEGQGLYRMEGLSGQAIFVSLGLPHLTRDLRNQVFALADDGPNTLWVGTGGGLCRLDKKTLHCTLYLHDPKDPGSIPFGKIKALCRDREGSLWVGSDAGGAALLDTRTGKFQRFVHAPDVPTTINGNNVYAIFRDSRETVWIGTADGLNRFDRALAGFRRIGRLEGLANEVVNSIQEDRSGNLWLSTNAGLTCYVPDSGQVRNFNVRDGLQSNEFNHGAALTLADGSLLFGGVAGITRVFPERMRTNEFVPPIVFTDFRLFGIQVPIGPDASGRTILERPIAETPVLHLNHQDRVFSLEFAALDYTNPEKNLYSVYLEGFDQTWSQPSAERTATYTNLDPGEYTLRVRACNDDGIWNWNGTSLRIVIAPPLWRTWWFHAVVALALLAVGILAGFVHARNVRKKNRRLEQSVRERTHELQERTAQLEQSLADVRTLSGLIPICCNCKSIRNDDGFWEQVEQYIAEHSEANFSHSICPDCFRKLYPDLAGAKPPSGGKPA